MKQFLNKIKSVLFGVTAALIVTAAVVGALSFADVSADDDGYKELQVFTEVLSIVKRSYVEEVKIKDLVYGAIRGMLSSLDPHSAFMTPDAYKEMQVDTRGEFGGLGIQISIKNGVLTIIAPIEDTPAFRAGLKSADKIIKIEGEFTKNMSLFDAVKIMRGPKGTEVTISVLREGWKSTKDFTIVRDIIKIKSVKSRIIDDVIGYVKIRQFQEKTDSEVEKALKEILEQDVRGVILDLRNNPGGLLKSAVDVSSRFLEPGKLVVYTKSRNGDKSEYRTSPKTPTVDDLPMIVLVNQGSASASEIVAGAMKDWRRAVILGVKTFGKASVQSVVPLSDGSGLRLTTARYYTPKGTSIQLTGIKPDIEVKLASTNGEKLHPVMREKDLKGALDNDQYSDSGKDSGDTEKAPLSVKAEDDTQLNRAIDLLKTWTVFKELPAAS